MSLFSLFKKPKRSLKGLFFTENNLALAGYDPVAYFHSGKAQKGKAEFELEWMETTWRFASVENRDKFAASPHDFAPQFGGYCAWGMKEGYRAKTDPKAWTIYQGHLYLNYNPKYRRKWQSDKDAFISIATENWSRGTTQEVE